MGRGAAFSSGAERDESGKVTWHYISWPTKNFNICRRGLTEIEDLKALLFTFSGTAPSEVHKLKIEVSKGRTYLMWKRCYVTDSNGEVKDKTTVREEAYCKRIARSGKI